MRIAVTGATGFVGRRLVPVLTQRGHHVVAVCRNAATTTLSADIERATVADIADADALARAFTNCDAVVHLAARVHIMHDTTADPCAAFRRVNVEGTRAVCAAALRAGAQRVVYVSSVKADTSGESDAARTADPYGASKHEAEGVLADALRGRASWTVIRPPLVYGPGVAGNFLRLLRLVELAERIPLPLGGIPNRRSLVYVGNLADAIGRSFESPAARDRTYAVSDMDDLSTSELMRRLARALGGRALLLPCPTVLARSGLALVGRAAEAERLFGSLVVDAEPLRRDLDWRPPYSVDEGLADTARWWRSARAQARDAGAATAP